MQKKGEHSLLYIKLYRVLKDLIVQGNFPENLSLPGTRTLAEFTSGNWYFQSPAVTIASPVTQQPSIFSLCYGDVNGSYNPPSLRTIPEVSFAPSTVFVEGLNKGEVALLAPANLNLGAVTLHIAYPAEWGKARFHSGLLQNNLLWNDLGGMLSVSWYELDGQYISAGSILGVVHFENATDETDYSRMEITGNSELADVNAIPLPNVRLLRASSAKGSFVSANLFPNPARGAAQLSLNLPEDSEISYTVSDLRGRVLNFSAPSLFPKGSHSLPLDALPAGQYLIRLECSGSWGHQIIPVRLISLP